MCAIKDLFREHSKTILVYLAKETIVDPFSKAVEKVYLNPIPIKAIVTDLTTTKVRYAIPGIETSKAKEIIIEKRHEELLLQSQKIDVDSISYIGWRVNGKMQYREEGNFLRVYIYTEK